MADSVDPRVAAARAKAEAARQGRAETPEERERRLAELKKQAAAKKAAVQQAKGGAPAADGAAEAAAVVVEEPRGWKKAAHDQAVRDLAATRFRFPNEEHPELRTFTNRPLPQMAIETPAGEKLLPDLVVMEWRVHRPVIIGEVETTESLQAEDTLEKWRSFAALDSVAFYLYVPLQNAFEVRDLLRKHKIRVDGLRAWRYMAGFPESLDVTEIPLRGNLLAALFHG
ncbi:MAG TPA: hypothetical protein VIO14_06815 [Dehalococcoidia bacterium]